MCPGCCCRHRRLSRGSLYCLLSGGCCNRCLSRGCIDGDLGGGGVQECLCPGGCCFDRLLSGGGDHCDLSGSGVDRCLSRGQLGDDDGGRAGSRGGVDREGDDQRSALTTRIAGGDRQRACAWGIIQHAQGESRVGERHRGSSVHFGGQSGDRRLADRLDGDGRIGADSRAGIQPGHSDLRGQHADQHADRCRSGHAVVSDGGDHHIDRARGQ